MLEWQSLGDDRITDPTWEADWHRGTAIGLLVRRWVAVVAIGSLGWAVQRCRLQRNSTPSGPHKVHYVKGSKVIRQSSASR